MRNDTVLVVDDEPSVLDAYTHYLDPPQAPTVFRSSRGAGRAREETRSAPPRYRLLTAQSGEEAIEVVRREAEAGRRIAAGFFDIKMPGGLDGLETIRAVHAIDPDILCTVVTAYNDRSVEDIGRYFPAERQDEWDYLNKPFTEGEIQQKARNLVSSWLRRRREEAQRHDLEHLLQQLSLLKGLGFPDLLRCLDYVLGRVVAFTGSTGGFLATMGRGLQFQVGTGSLADEEAAREALEALRAAQTPEGLLLDPQARIKADLFIVPILCVRADQVVVVLHWTGEGNDKRDLVRILAENAAAAVDNYYLFQELQQLNASLEERIGERTRDLLASNQRLSQSSAELQEMLHRLKQTQQQLVHSEKFAVLGQTAATIAHEINNPACFIQVNLEELSQTIQMAGELCRLLDSGADLEAVRAWRRGCGFDAAAAEMAEMVEECRGGLSRILTIVRDLRCFARSGDSQETIELTEVVDRALRIMSNEIKHRAAIHVARREQVTVSADEGRLMQVMINLISNALHAFGTRPAAENRLEVSVWPDNGGACISLSDNGCGIPGDIRDKIFDPFFTTKPIGQGTGLGLGICRSIIEQHGGTITVESMPGSGSEFRITLPG
ncbi:MAG TPA: ATP-binding protein [Kofleriaceae bacterium]|nr:ATP-binding protein [Kofleriaceae bacterium]